MNVSCGKLLGCKPKRNSNQHRVMRVALVFGSSSGRRGMCMAIASSKDNPLSTRLQFLEHSLFLVYLALIWRLAMLF